MLRRKPFKSLISRVRGAFRPLLPPGTGQALPAFPCQIRAGLDTRPPMARSRWLATRRLKGYADLRLLGYGRTSSARTRQ